MRRRRNAKILATLGPASTAPDVIEALFLSGADVFRLNFSHGTHDDHKRSMDTIRALERRTTRPIAVLADMQGPKLRVGTFVDGAVSLETGRTYRLDLDDTPGDATRASLPHPEIFAAVTDGDELLLDDGKLKLRVLEHKKKKMDVEVLVGGRLSERKGVNLPGTLLPISALTEKDRRDLSYALELGADWIALSFVQRPEDVAEARKLIAGRAAVMSKMEKPSAVDCLDELIDLSDGIMVARGDLGVELPPEDVPPIQKRIVRACRKAGKPVVVATQMLESMISAPTPTRAEASDVATAVYDGADAVMLSAETAVGKFPREAVTIMNRIIERVERDPRYRALMDADHPEPEPTAPDAITKAASQVATTIGASAICAYSTSGSTTLRAARERPPVPVLGLTPNIAVARRLSILWGVHNVFTADPRDFAEMVKGACEVALQGEFGAKGERIVITAGVPFGTPGSTNVLRIAWLD